MIVGLNSDDSVKRLKGEGRPINNEQDRAAMLRALSAVDLVVVFQQDTLLELIKEIRPDVLVKGEDYTDKLVVGQAEVENWGGEVKLCPLIDGYSTTNQIVELSNRDAIETVRQPQLEVSSMTISVENSIDAHIEVVASIRPMAPNRCSGRQA